MSDGDLNPEFLSDDGYTDKYGVRSREARYIIDHVDGFVVQTPRQQTALREVWKNDSYLVTNPLDLAGWDVAIQEPSRLPGNLPDAPFVLWIGRADRFSKRPLEMVAALRALPSTPFVMVMNPVDADVRRELLAADCQNLTLIDQVPFACMAPLMARARILVSTGSAQHEGLPNVFLQAAASRLPIISLEASKEWIAASGSGICLNGNRVDFIAAITHFVAEQSTNEVKQLGASGRQYVEREHDAMMIGRKLFDFSTALHSRQKSVDRKNNA